MGKGGVKNLKKLPTSFYGWFLTVTLDSSVATSILMIHPLFLLNAGQKDRALEEHSALCH